MMKHILKICLALLLIAVAIPPEASAQRKAATKKTQQRKTSATKVHALPLTSLVESYKAYGNTTGYTLRDLDKTLPAAGYKLVKTYYSTYDDFTSDESEDEAIVRVYEKGGIVVEYLLPVDESICASALTITFPNEAEKQAFIKQLRNAGYKFDGNFVTKSGRNGMGGVCFIFNGLTVSGGPYA